MTATLILSFMYIHMSVCLYWFSQSHTTCMHFNTLLFSTHKAVITLRGYLISTAYWQFLFTPTTSPPRPPPPKSKKKTTNQPANEPTNQPNNNNDNNNSNK